MYPKQWQQKFKTAQNEVVINMFWIIFLILTLVTNSFLKTIILYIQGVSPENVLRIILPAVSQRKVYMDV